MPDQLLPQPPPDAHAPPAGEHALRSRRKMGWLIAVGLICMLLLPMLPILARVGKRMGRSGRGQTETVSNIRQLGLALDGFETEYGKFPDSTTATEVKRKTGSTLALSSGSSNELFAQLIAAEIAQSETMFYAKAKSARKPDNVFNTDATVLAHGECTFAYLYGVSSKDHPQTPLAFGPVIPGTHTLDLTTNEGKIVVLKVDNSVISLPVNAAGHILAGGGLELLDPRQPYWHGKAPDVRWPK